MTVRDAAGGLIVLAALGVLFRAVLLLHEKDYLACIILTMTGLALTRAGAELLRRGSD